MVQLIQGISSVVVFVSGLLWVLSMPRRQRSFAFCPALLLLTIAASSSVYHFTLDYDELDPEWHKSSSIAFNLSVILLEIWTVGTHIFQICSPLTSDGDVLACNCVFSVSLNIGAIFGFYYYELSTTWSFHAIFFHWFTILPLICCGYDSSFNTEYLGWMVTAFMTGLGFWACGNWVDPFYGLPHIVSNVLLATSTIHYIERLTIAAVKTS